MKARSLIAAKVVIFIFILSGYLHAGLNENVKEWINQLSDAKQRAQAKGNLVRAQDKAVGELISNLQDEHINASVKVDIIQILQANKIKEAIPAIREYADSKKVRLRLSSVEALGVMEDASLSDIFKKASADRDEDVRIAALTSLINIKDEGAIDIFIKSLSDPKVKVRLKGLDALDAFKDKTAIPALIEKLKDSNSSVILKSVDLLSNFKNQEVVEALVGNLNTENVQIKIKTIEALARIKDASVIPALKALSHDEYIDVQVAADNAVKAIES